MNTRRLGRLVWLLTLALGWGAAMPASAERIASKPDTASDSRAADLARARSLLEDATGTPILGYRAPSFSISRANPWAFDCIAQAGHRYSSSVYPVRHDHYGMPDAPRFARRSASSFRSSS